jgi:hypothetical protein
MPMSAYELAHLNIATLKGPLDSPLLAEFVANLERINALRITRRDLCGDCRTMPGMRRRIGRWAMTR